MALLVRWYKGTRLDEHFTYFHPNNKYTPISPTKPELLKRSGALNHGWTFVRTKITHPQLNKVDVKAVFSLSAKASLHYQQNPRVEHWDRGSSLPFCECFCRASRARVLTWQPSRFYLPHLSFLHREVSSRHLAEIAPSSSLSPYYCCYQWRSYPQ